jgi:hypothetical protein
MDKEPQVDAETTAEETPGALVRQVSHEVLHPLNVEEQTAAMAEHQAMLRGVLDDSDYQGAGGGKRFVKKSGWRKIATAYSLSLEVVPGTDKVDRAEDGSVERASVWVRATAPNGRFAEGDGYCDVAEERFSGNRGNKTKLENDLRGTASTRATNRAISNLVGMGDVSAEEMDAPKSKPEHPHGEPASEDLARRFVGALHYLVGQEAGDRTATAIYADCGGYLPKRVARAVGLAVAAKKDENRNLAEAAVGAENLSPRREPDDAAEFKVAPGEPAEADAEVVDAEPVLTEAEAKADDSIPFG